MAYHGVGLAGVHGFPFNWIRTTQLNSVGNIRQLYNRMIQLRMFRAPRGIQNAITKSRNRTEGLQRRLGFLEKRNGAAII
jgi:hypothetical protein